MTRHPRELEWGPDEVGRYGPLIPRRRASRYVSEIEQEPFQGKVFAAKNAPKANRLKTKRRRLCECQSMQRMYIQGKEKREGVEIQARSICNDDSTTVSSVQFALA